MQSTIRGALTRLLRTNSSVDSFEQEVKFFMIKWTRRGHDGKEFDRIAKSYLLRAKNNAGWRPEESQVEALCVQNTTFEEFGFFPFRRNVIKHVTVSCTEFLGS